MLKIFLLSVGLFVLVGCRETKSDNRYDLYIPSELNWKYYSDYDLKYTKATVEELILVIGIDTINKHAKFIYSGLTLNDDDSLNLHVHQKKLYSGFKTDGDNFVLENYSYFDDSIIKIMGDNIFFEGNSFERTKMFFCDEFD